MPHQCTNCNKVFPDGSKEMLSGCPQCGGNKFQFRPSGAGADPPSAESRADGASANRVATETLPASESTDESDGGLADRVAGSRSTVRDWVDDRLSNRKTADASRLDRSDESTDTAEPGDAADGDGESRSENGPQPSTPGDDTTGAEDRAQATARSDVVSPSELPETPDPSEDGETPPPDADGQVIEPTSDHRPGLEELREELNEQFESIRVVNPGQYELNLMELYDREEYIISLKEDGRYVIEVPDAWNAADEDE